MKGIYKVPLTPTPILLVTSILCIGLLTGCGTSQKTARSDAIAASVTQKNLATLKNFEATGKVGFSNGQKGGNASIRWVQEGDDYNIHLYGPFGSGSIQIAGQGNAVSLTRANGQNVTAKTPESLVQKELGWSIPVSGLRYWLRGLPVPGTTPKIQLNENKDPAELEQLGWRVQYLTYQNIGGLRLPEQMILQNGSVRLKFIFKQWTFS